MLIRMFLLKLKTLAPGVAILLAGCGSLAWSEIECLNIEMVEMCMPIGEKPAFIDDFRLVTPARINLNKGFLKAKLGIRDDDLVELEKSEDLVKKWNKKARNARQKKKELFDDSQDEKTRAAGVPKTPALRIDGKGSVLHDRDAHDAWVKYFENNNDHSFRCTWNNEDMNCLEWIKTEKYKFFGELFNLDGKTLNEEKKFLLKYLGLVLRLPNIDLSPQGPYKVFFHNVDNASPQIDNIGNLYLPKKLFDRLNQFEIEAVLNHEIAHLVELDGAMIAWLIGNGFKEIYKKNNLKDEELPILDELIAFIRQPDEAYIDLLAAYLFQESHVDIKVNGELISSLEGSTSLRSEISIALSEAMKVGMSTKEALRARIIKSRYQCDALSSQWFNKSWSFAPSAVKKYRDAFLKYQAYRVPSQMMTMMGKNYMPLDFKAYSDYASNKLIADGCVDLPFSAGYLNYVLKLNSFEYAKP